MEGGLLLGVTVTLIILWSRYEPMHAGSVTSSSVSVCVGVPLGDIQGLTRTISMVQVGLCQGSPFLLPHAWNVATSPEPPSLFVLKD